MSVHGNDPGPYHARGFASALDKIAIEATKLQVILSEQDSSASLELALVWVGMILWAVKRLRKVEVR